jgi:two-component system phosphate regulon sensor histidine kinase PhoR
MAPATIDPNQKLQLLYQISLDLGTLDLNDVLGKVLSLTVSNLGASKGSIFVLNDEGQVVQQILARADLPAEDTRQVVRTVMDVGLAGWACKHRTPVVVADTAKDDRWVSLPDDPDSSRSALAVPLMRGGRIVGLLTLVHPEPGVFTQQDLDLAVAIGGLAAVAVENARLFTQVNADRQTLAAVIRNVRAPILVTDPDWRILLVNPPAAAILELSGEEATGQPLVTAIDNPDLVALLEEAAPEPGSTISGEIHTQDGSSYLASLSPVPGVGHALVLHDITFLKRLDQLKTESMTAVSHDLRGPLSIILSSAEMMVRYTDLGREQRDFLRIISTTADGMRRLVERMLDLSRIESGQAMDWKRVSVEEMCQTALAEAEVQARLKGVELAADLIPGPPLVRADVLWLGQAVANLLNNAIKYTPAGGEVTLCAGPDMDQRNVLIEVRDTGPGIPADALETVFGKFYRVGTHKTIDQEGDGLGLALVRSIVEAHGGQAWVESEWGSGSRFFISLPLDEVGQDD